MIYLVEIEYNSDREKFERVDEDFEKVDDTEEEVVDDDIEIVDDDVEIVDSDVEVIAKPKVELSPTEKWYIAISDYMRISREIENLEKRLEIYVQTLKTGGLKYDTYKLKREIRRLKKELAKLKYERMLLRIKIYENCTKKYRDLHACEKCPWKKDCILAIKFLKSLREKKVKSWLFKK